MKINNNMIEHLNCLLNDELRTANQYFLHSRIFNNWGLKRLHSIEHKESLDELNHVDIYAKRILFLEGTIVLKSFNELNIKNNIKEILKMDLQLEYYNIDHLKESIKYSESVQDYISKDIMIKILHEEEKHVHSLETELDLMEKIGIHNYIQSQLQAEY